MTRKLVREVIFETRQVEFHLAPHAARPAACPVCQAPLLTPAEAAGLHGVSQRTLFQRLEQGLLHFCETGDGQLYFCAASLPPPSAPP